MPGVPSGRGCEACRKQKKKCDAAKPKCSRCTRLQIPCIGGGQQRYKFHNQTVTRGGGRSGAWSETTAAPAPQAQAQAQAGVGAVSLSPPSNRSTIQISQFVSALGVLDPRFDLSVYGLFVYDIPRRLGRNEALDAAVDAMTTTLPLLQTRQPTAESYRKYAKALNALRVCLSDPEKLASVDTMCALYLVVICQGWMGNVEDFHPSHGEAVAHILSFQHWTSWSTKFEADMLTTLAVLVILESYINPRIQLDPNLWGLPETFGPRSPADPNSWVESLRNRNLARITTLVRDPQAHLQEVEATYYRLRGECAQMSAILAAIPVVAAPDGKMSSPIDVRSRRMHVRYQTGNGILLLIAIMLSKILRTYKPPTVDLARLRTDVAGFVDSVITLAENASQYRPLGSSAMPLFLFAAYSVLEENQEEKETRMVALLEDYRSDFIMTRSINIGQDLRAWLNEPSPPDCLPASLDVLAGEEGQSDMMQLARKIDMCCIL